MPEQIQQKMQRENDIKQGGASGVQRFSATEKSATAQLSEAKLAQTWQQEASAALVWSAIVDGGDTAASRVIDTYGYAKALKKLQAAALPEIAPRSVCRWEKRLAVLDVAPLTHYLAQGYQLILRGDKNWPTQLDDLGEQRPICLWVRGSQEVLHKPMLAIIGARAASAAGERIALDLAYELSKEYLIVSGGAIGIDAQAHRGALLAGKSTVIVSAAGVDRIYPKCNQEIFTQCVESGGAIVSESIPGASPQRFRFLLRNRIIAALGKAVVVVEAGVRSGALNTARHALEIGREVGALPGSIEAPHCIGTNQLIRHGATLIMNAAHVRELVGAIGVDLVAPESLSDGGFTLPLDDEFDPLANRIYDVLSKVRYESTEVIARRAGEEVLVTRIKLNRLVLGGKAVMKDGKWKKA